MGVRARLQGFEFEATRRLVEGPQTLDLELNADFTHATDLTHAEPLPRIAPLRLRGALQWSSGPWGARLDIDHAARQSRVPADDVLGETTSNTRANLSLSYRTTTPAGNALFFLRITNLTDRLAYNASSIDTIRNLAPLPGRGFKAGVQLAF